MQSYPKRLIEVDLPIKRIARAATQTEKRFPTPRGHISTLHTWWARRPLGVCRAAICAALWPDPADPLCTASFISKAREELEFWAENNVKLLSKESGEFFLKVRRSPDMLHEPINIREGLLHFIADFAAWSNANNREFLKTARALTVASQPTADPLLVFDPFSGGGAIPLEAARLGTEVFASDLNPVAVLLERIILEYVPRYGNDLLQQLRLSRFKLARLLTL